VTPFAVHREKTHGKEGSLPCAKAKNARQRRLFAVRQGHKRTAKVLFLLLVLVTLPCVFWKTHGKVAIAVFFSHLKIPKKSQA
jgi:hypothetical protein